MVDSSPFRDAANVYDALIDWPKRLAHEAGFYRRRFSQASVHRLVDVACGPGHHAAMFHRWGLEVQGSDVSAEMISQAKHLHGTPEGLQWVVRSFEQPIEAAEAWDAAICVGNSLALAADHAAVEQVIRRLVAAVRRDGVIVVHVLNLWSFPDGPCRWQKCFRLTDPGGDRLVIKGVHRAGTRGFVDLLVSTCHDPPTLESESIPLLGLEAADLERCFVRAGCRSFEVWGGYAEQPYQRESSTDLIVVARR